MTQEMIAAIFEEWKRRYDEDPEGYQDHEAFISDAPQTYGEGAGRYFSSLLAEMYTYEIELERYVRKDT